MSSEDFIQSRLPAILAQAGFAADGLVGEVVSHGESGDLLVRLDAPDLLVVKLADRAHGWNADLLRREAEALGWLRHRARVPGILWIGEADGFEILIMERLAGEPISHFAPDHARAALIAGIGALSALHGLPVADCPFDQTLTVKLAAARDHVAAGIVDEAAFDAERAGMSAVQALAQLEASRPPAEDLVVAHGDASLPNFIWSPGEGVWLIDLGRLGLADRHQDLAIFLRSALRNHPHIDAVALVREHYRLAPLDAAKLDFYRLLDEFF